MVGQSRLVDVQAFLCTAGVKQAVGQASHDAKSDGIRQPLQGLDEVDTVEEGSGTGPTGPNQRVDESVVEDGQFVTSRKPGDMPLEMRRIFERFESETAKEQS